MAKATKKKSSQDLKNLSDKGLEELGNLLKQTQEEYFKLQMEFKVDKLKDVHAPKKKRKEIAKIKTVIREKELEAVSDRVTN